MSLCRIYYISCSGGGGGSGGPAGGAPAATSFSGVALDGYSYQARALLASPSRSHDLSHSNYFH